ncbi:hypothetical protein [Pyxidicoccus trucidator]|uniref:hypothetical protein n=1 Tax=Pyxidicoccus trucidator TaxID=2709662 RepID=UPI001F071D47|nr:hypothetical protein [Pyxidicoccus trucidator]
MDEVAVKEALGREQELAPRHRLAVERAELALKSPTGAVSEMEKLERKYPQAQAAVAAAA